MWWRRPTLWSIVCHGCAWYPVDFSAMAADQSRIPKSWYLRPFSWPKARGCCGTGRWSYTPMLKATPVLSCLWFGAIGFSTWFTPSYNQDYGHQWSRLGPGLSELATVKRSENGWLLVWLVSVIKCTSTPRCPVNHLWIPPDVLTMCMWTWWALCPCPRVLHTCSQWWIKSPGGQRWSGLLKRSRCFWSQLHPLTLWKMSADVVCSFHNITSDRGPQFI